MDQSRAKCIAGSDCLKAVYFMNRALVEFSVFQVNSHPVAVLHGVEIAQHTRNRFAVRELLLDFQHALFVRLDLLNAARHISVVRRNAK